MSAILSGGRIVLEDAILDPGSLVLDGGVIAEVRPGAIDWSGDEWYDLRGHLLVPGFIDVHVHGVEGIGWEAIPRPTLAAFFDHLAAARNRVWVATFRDVAKYMRERQHATVRTRTTPDGAAPRIALTHTLDPALYDLPLTLKTYVPAGWTRVRVTQGSTSSELTPSRDAGGTFVMYPARPNAEDVVLTRH